MNHRSTLAPLATLPLLGLSVFIFSACGSSSAGGDGGFDIIEASNGFGRLLPHTIPVANNLGLPTNEIIEIRKIEDLLDNLTQANPITPPTEWRTGAILPNNSQGNHFIYVRFTRDLDVESIMTGAGGANGLVGNISVVQVLDQSTVEPLAGVAFIGGKTFGPNFDDDPDSAGDLALETWVSLDPMGNIVAADIDGAFPGQGFPGTDGGFAGDDVLVDDSTFIFVADTDGNLATHETFPANSVQIQLRIGTGVLSIDGENMPHTGLASSTVGPDMVGPEVQVAGSAQTPITIPSDGDVDVDPLTNIEITFTEPLQVLSVGSLNDGKPPIVTAAIQLRFGPSTGQVEVPFHVRPFSLLDLTRLELTPIFPFPGNGPVAPGDEDMCGDFASVDIVVNTAQFQDLCGNVNTLAPVASFTTRQGPGLVNAPVVPEAVYIGRRGANPGISIIDLNGFGGGTGNPAYDVARPITQGASNYPNNPNVALQGAVLVPPLAPGSCTFDGGSAGAFTLTRDSTLNDLLATNPILDSVEDMAIGHSLDLTFNNAAPFGCQSGGGNICSTTGLKRVLLAFGSASTLTQSASAVATLTIVGAENLASFGPHPNPPPIIFPPLCTSPFIAGQEPTSVDSGFLYQNLLVPGGNRFGDPAINQPPQNLLSSNQTAFFQGPTPPQTSASLCQFFNYRQQVGHFLYVVDRNAGEVVVLNSNRFTVIDRIRLPDPTTLAMSPNLDLLAVTNQSADLVAFINIDPSSARFHQVTRTTRVGVGPTGIAWEPGNEDIFVCNQSDSTVSIISAFTLNVRKTVRNQISSPIDVAITPRQFGYGFRRGVYFAYILNSDGRVAFFESGPDGVNGFGFDDVIASFPITFSRPKAIQPSLSEVDSAVWVVHENPIDLEGQQTGQSGGAISLVGIVGGLAGIVPLTLGAFSDPSLRDLQIGVRAAIGESNLGLSGVPVDICYDNLSNLSALANFSSQFSTGSPLPYNGKAIVKAGGGGGIPVEFPQFMFLPIPGEGLVDVIEFETGTLQRFDTNVFEPGIQSIPVRNATIVVDYFRQ